MTKRALLTLVVVVVTLSTTARTRVAEFPIDATKASLVSEPTNLMTHTSAVHITDKGEVWTLYYRDQTNHIENPKFSTIELMLSRFDIKKWKSPKVEHTVLLKAGGSIGKFTQQDNRPPYDPKFFIDKNTIRCLFTGSDKDEWELMACDLDPKSGKPVGEVSRCTLTYLNNGEKVTIPITDVTFRDVYKSMGITDFKGYQRPIILSEFYRHGEWWYNGISNWCCRGSRPVIVRTKDGINYEVVFTCPEFTYGSSEVIINIHKDRMYVIARTARPQARARRGTYLGVYSLSGECLRKPYRVGDVESLPALKTYKGKVYAMFNVYPNRLNEEGRRVARSRVRLAELDRDGTILRAWEYLAPYSMQYYTLSVFKGSMYLSFIEGRYGGRDMYKGNLSFVKLNL